MGRSNQPSKTIINHFQNFLFFKWKCWVRNGKNQFFPKSQKKLFQLNKLTKPHSMNLFRMVFMTKAVKSTQFEKRRKNTFFRTLKKWKNRKNGLQTNRMKKWPVKASMPCQIRIACQFLKQFIGFFFKNETIFLTILVVVFTLISTIYGQNSKITKTTIFIQFWPSNTLYPLNWLSGARINHQKPLLITFKNFYFLNQNVESDIGKNNFFQKVKKSCPNWINSLSHTLWTCSEWFSWTKL